jgi:two-component system, cell cycle sensor histidine kinase and response regulator CckA
VHLGNILDNFRVLGDLSNDAILLLDEEGRILAFNDRASQLYGYPDDELEGMAILDLRAPSARAMLSDELRHAWQPGGRVFESWNQRKDGSIFPVEVSARTVALDDGRVRLGIVRDITERVQNEHTMRSLVTAIEQAAETVVVTDVDGNIRYCNPAFEKITGYPAAEVIGQNPRVLKSGKHDAQFYERLWTTIKSGEVWSGRFTNRKKDGSNYEEDATVSPIHDAVGNITGFVAVKRDITERANLENQLLQAQKLESVGRLAGGVAHDFNNLLTVINGYGDLLLRRLKEDDPLRDSVAEICHAGARAADLTRQLLAFSRKQLIEPHLVDINRLIAQNRDMLQRLVGEDIEIETCLNESLGGVMADPGQILQVVMNLVVNARDAMAKGGRLAIETGNVDVDLGIAAAHPGLVPGEYVRLTVSDTGTGIEKENLERIFDPFFTTKGEGEGTGLGLATSYGIVRQSGGSIGVRSDPGSGTAFDIYLPRTDAVTADAARPVSSTPLPGSETLLVVEDQESVRKLTVTALKRFGYRVLEAPGGAEALLLAQQYADPIHLMVTDVVMPRMTGRELAERMKELRPDMRVLYMSGYPQDIIADRGNLEPGLLYIAKPFAPNTLAARVREALEQAPLSIAVLVVDDEAGVRGYFQRVLTDAGFQVLVADNGEEALRMARESAFDVVLTDLVMPVREGIETIRILRQEHPGLRIIAVSGAFDGAFLKLAKGLGAHTTLKKPVSPSELISAVRGVLA